MNFSKNDPIIQRQSSASQELKQEIEDTSDSIRMVQRLFYCHLCQNWFKVLISPDDVPPCPKCSQTCIEQVKKEHQKDFQKQIDQNNTHMQQHAQNKAEQLKNASQQQQKKSEQNSGSYRMVFNTPSQQERYHTRINVSHLSSNSQPSSSAAHQQQPQQPGPRFQSSFFRAQHMLVNGHPAYSRVQYDQGLPLGPNNESGLDLPFNLLDTMNFLTGPEMDHHNQIDEQMPGFSQQSIRNRPFPFSQTQSIFGNRINDSFFSGFNLPDFSSFFGFNPSNFQTNFRSNFRSSNADPMFDLAQYLSELEALNHPQQNPVSEQAMKKIPVVKIGEEHCKRLQEDGKIRLELPRCTVCVQDFKMSEEGNLLPCGHIFHADCLHPWLKQHNTCPVCRFKLPTE